MAQKLKPRSSSQTNRLNSSNIRNKRTSKSPAKNNGKFEKNIPRPQLKSYAEMFNQQYNKFFKILNPLVGVRGKKLNFYNLRYNIEEIYSIRFIKDTSNLRHQLTKSPESQDIDMKDPFPNFVAEFLTNKYIKKPMVDQHSLDLLLSVDHFRKTYKEIEIFSKFLNEEYDTEDLIFFLFVRSCIEKEMRMMFIEKARDEIKLQYQEDKDNFDTEVYLNIKIVLKIANTIFGNEEELLLNSFMEKIENKLKNSGNDSKNKNMIKASSILEITLEDYHQSRKLYGQNSNNLNFEKNEENVPNSEKLKANLFEEYDDNGDDLIGSQGTSNKRVSFSKLAAKEDPKSKKEATQKTDSKSDKISKLKSLIFNYMKEKELDTFFDKLMNSYSVYEKDLENIENNLTIIKDLVSKKLALLISIIFNQDQNNWFVSLKIKEEDLQNRKHYTNLVTLMTQIINYQPENVPESLVENFGLTLLSTSELNSQINKLVLKYFG